MTKQNPNAYTIFSVDKLIQNLGDPRVAEKLRIYRLVEEQFALVESQVQKEVYFRIKYGCKLLYPCAVFLRMKLR